MKFFTLAILLTASAVAAPTHRDVEAWKARFPAVAQTNNPVIRQLNGDCAWLARQATPANLQRTVSMARDKANAALATANERLSSQRGSKATGRERADAQESKTWIESRLLPYIEQGATLAGK